MWLASAAYFIGNAMQGMAAAWYIVERTNSTFLAAVVQTAVFLPMFVLALPAGVLADTTDRRRLLLWQRHRYALLVHRPGPTELGEGRADYSPNAGRAPCASSLVALVSRQRLGGRMGRHLWPYAPAAGGRRRIVALS